MQADIVIVGGGIMGAALAYWMTRLEPTASVVVIERDPTYATASSALSAASIRQQFSTPVNIRISQASIDFLRAAGELLAVDDSQPDIGLTEAGYLYLAGESSVQSLRRAHAIQTQHGAEVALLTPAQLAERFAWLETADLAAGTLGLRGEEWFEGYRLLTAFARKARSQSARFMRGEGNRAGAQWAARREGPPCRRLANGLWTSGQRGRALGALGGGARGYRPAGLCTPAYGLCRRVSDCDDAFSSVDRPFGILDPARGGRLYCRPVAR